jgi:putative Holliday junction resolvase
MEEWNMERAAARIADEAAGRRVERLVLGLPKNMDGSEGPRAEKSREFKSMLENASGLEVVLWDERRSSIEAHAILHAGGRKEKDHRKTVDAVAASLILEGYLGSLK